VPDQGQVLEEDIATFVTTSHVPALLSIRRSGSHLLDFSNSVFPPAMVSSAAINSARAAEGGDNSQVSVLLPSQLPALLLLQKLASKARPRFICEGEVSTMPGCLHA